MVFEWKENPDFMVGASVSKCGQYVLLQVI